MPGVQIEQQRARRVRRVSHVHGAAREPPHEPAVDRAEGELAALRPRTRARHRVEDPGELRTAEIRVEHESGAAPEERLVACGAQRSTPIGSASVLPDDRTVDRRAGRAIPDDRRLALVRDADTRALAWRDARRRVGIDERPRDRRFDVDEVVLDLAGLRVVLRELARRLPEDARVVREHDDRAARRALIDREEMSAHGRATLAARGRGCKAALS